MARAETIERLRQFLRELTPAARILLIGELERAVLRGDDGESGAELVLRQLCLIVREQQEGAPRAGHAARLFFRPFEPFLVDDADDDKHPGRITRASIQLLWSWVAHELLPDDARSLTEQVSSALSSGDAAMAEARVRAFQDSVLTAMDASFEAAADGDQVQRRLLAKIGTQRASKDAAMLRCVLRGRDVLARLGDELPLHIGKLDPVALRTCRGKIESAAAQDRELFLYALLTVMNRLAAPWQLIRFGTNAANSRSAARVAETDYAIVVTIVLAELERLVGELRRDLSNGGGVAVSALLKTIHDCVRGLRSELAIPVDSDWGRALAAQRGQIAELLRCEIDSIPGRVRRLLRARPAGEIESDSVLDAGEVSNTEALVTLVDASRLFAGELAINETAQRANNELRQYLDGATQALLDGLRQAAPDERRFRQSQFEAGRRFCGIVFGHDYAEALGKAAQLAGGPAPQAAEA